jgi:hypothetical protein
MDTMTVRTRLGALAVAVAMLAGAPAAAVDGADHLKCYHVRDAQRLQALVDVGTARFPIEQGCKLSSKSVELCVPAEKVVREARVDGQPIVPDPTFGPPAAGEYVCYKLVCPKAERLPPTDTVGVEDQFGPRSLSHLRPSRLCTPATDVQTPCGPTFCAPGLVCCNPVMGICAPPGQPCIL